MTTTLEQPAPPSELLTMQQLLTIAFPLLLNVVQACQLVGMNRKYFLNPNRQIRLKRFGMRVVKVEGNGKGPIRRFHRDSLIKAVERAAERGEL